MSNAFSREFLGDNPTKKDLLKIGGVTLLAVVTIGYSNYAELSELPIWKSILFLLMLSDIFAGAIGNFTKSTQDHYKNDTKKRVTFLLMHILHISLLVVAVGHVWFGIGLFVYTIAAGLLVNASKTVKQQEINAASVICLGFLLFYVAFPAPKILIWLPAVFLIKLVMGFSIRREDDYS
ncbi:hypothetical protein [Flammeovirga pacifica]|uniref:Uncharacterized protein n=1 Tax=Flammeovirga pacifica TaxID=915059 RepID=A0A1S1YU73_FLAPC|nr:hypothetical protein [Flammeovirga pacifica]OHX64556.1 hypothetical protein NH26_23575 [Flammeovirga pacifica]